MRLQTRAYSRGSWVPRLLRWVNLRPEESERTLLMFAFYTMTSIGLLWLEHTAVALFLQQYGAKLLPLVYITSAPIGSGLGFFYSRLQRILPMRAVLLAVAVFMALPLLILRVGLEVEYLNGLVILIAIFLLRLWLDASTILNKINTSIAANQLFNIREIKRTYPLISSGVLVADVISGFSLPFLLIGIGINNVIVIAALMILLGALILFYLGQRYQAAFPSAPIRQIEGLQPEYSSRRTTASVRRYIVPLFAFFIIGEILFLLIEFQYLGQLEQSLDTAALASFLGLFSGIVGLFELVAQWFISSRAIERLGVFVSAMFLPAAIVLVSIVTLTGLINFFLGLIILKFIDEILRYTLLAGLEPVLFQPLPERIRGSLQALVRGISEPVANGFAGVGILAIIALVRWALGDRSQAVLGSAMGQVFVSGIALLALAWLVSVWLLRSSYVSLLVQGAEQGRLGFLDLDLRAFKRAIVKVLEQPGSEADKRSCIQLLSQIDPANKGEILLPQLLRLSPALQYQSLEVLLEQPHPAYLARIQELIAQNPPADVFALALRYLWLMQPEPDVRTLKAYLEPEIDPAVRGTAAALILQRGTPVEKAQATNALQRMLRHKQERERLMGCRALGEADYLQALRLFIPKLLQDESVRVRCALLEVIAATRYEEFYPSLLRGLHYKSTREAATRALVRLGDEAIPLLSQLSQDRHKPDVVRIAALSALAQIGTPAVLDSLVAQLITSWGISRRNVLQILLKMPGEAGIDGVLDRVGRSGVEIFIEQELLFLGQVYAAMLDIDVTEELLLHPDRPELELLQRSLDDLESDAIARCFLLMKFLYSAHAMQAATFNLKSDSRTNIAFGLEILDNTLDIPTKPVLLSVVERRPLQEKLKSLGEIVPYKPMEPRDRLRWLLEFRHFLPDWSLACCFHLARAARWRVTSEQVVACLRHPTGFVREAVLAYLKEASPRALAELLPLLSNDPDKLVAAQVQQIILDLKD